ncbi:MAG: hypothetical protein MMC23_004274 [Stictis urceolatum]|nr:hypothetical protein [Stictis urceolata]
MTVPGKVTPTSSTTGKEITRQSRFADLQGRGRQQGSDMHILDLTKVKDLAQSYGNCAETWAFDLLRLQNEANLKNVYGIAVKAPSADVQIYDEKVERTEQRYEQLCGNCRKLITQIDLWGGSAKDTVVKTFNVIEWTLK